MRLLTRIFTFFLIINFCLSEEEFFTINGKRVVNIVSERFLSFSLDPVVLLTGLNLSDSSLQLAKHLSPAFIRLAGPSTEFVKYIDNEYEYDGEKDGNNASNVIVTPSMWFGVNEWLSLANLTPVFGINDLESNNGGKWDPKSTLQLLELSDKLNVSCFWQLGFDCSNKGESQYKEDLKTLHKTLERFPEKSGIWRIVASDLSRCQGQDSVDNLKKTLNDIQNIADIVMWEPQITNKKDLLAKILPDTESKLQFWTTAPKDLRPVSFSTAILWAQQIGDSAKTGYSVTLRQPRLHEMFSVTPVYWTSLLHKTFMGRVVLDIKKPFSFTNAHVYAHCTKKQNQFVRRGAMTVMIVNNQTETYTAFLRLGNPYLKNIEIQTYLLTSPNENSTEVFLNGNLLDEKLISGSKVNLIPKLRRANAAKPISLEVPAKSIGFFVLPGARIPACIKYEETEEETITEIEKDQKLELVEERENNKKLRNRGSFTLKDLQSLMEKELKSDEQFYKKSKLFRSDLLGSRMSKDNDYNKVYEKPSEAARNMFIERVKLAEKLRKPDFRFDNILKDMEKYQLPRQEKQKITTLDLSSSETTKILRDRARLKAARKNVMFTSKELDELFSRSNTNKNYPKFKRSLPKSPLETLKMKWEEQRDNWIVKAHDLKEQYEEQLERLRGNDFNSNFEKLRMKYTPSVFDSLGLKRNYAPRFKRAVDMETHWNNLKDQLGIKNGNILGINNLMDKIEEERQKLKMKWELDSLQNKFIEAKDKIVEAINLEDFKNKVQNAHDAVLKQIQDMPWKQKYEDAKDKILASVNINDLKDKLMTTWDDQKEKLLSNSRQFFRKRRAVNNNKLDALKQKMQRRQKASLRRSKLYRPLKRVRKEINMNLLNLKSRTDNFKLPSFKAKSSLLQKPLDINARTSEEFMSSSDEIKFEPKTPKGVIVAPKVRKPLSPMELFKSKAKLNQKLKPNQHSCEEEIFGRGLAHVNGDDLFNEKKEKEMDDCMKQFNEKNTNTNAFTTRLSDYLRNPLGMQKVEDMDLSLYDDVFRKKRDTSDEEKEITPKEIEDYKSALQKKIADLHVQMANDRKQLLEDRKRLQEERKVALNERLQQIHSNLDKTMVGLKQNTVDNDKFKKLEEERKVALNERLLKMQSNLDKTIVGLKQNNADTDKLKKLDEERKIAFNGRLQQIQSNLDKTLVGLKQNKFDSEQLKKLDEERKLAFNERLQKIQSNLDKTVVGLKQNTFDNDKLKKLDEERKVSLNERLQKIHSNLDKTIVGLTQNTMDNDKFKKFDELKSKLTLNSRFKKDPEQVAAAAPSNETVAEKTQMDKIRKSMDQFKVVPTLEELRQKRTERLKSMQEKLSNTSRGVNINSRLSDMGLDNLDNKKMLEDIKKSQDQILGEIEQKRIELQKEASLREIDFLRKRLENRQQLLDKLTGGVPKGDPEDSENHADVGERASELSTFSPLFKQFATTAKSVVSTTEQTKATLAKPELNLNNWKQKFQMKNNLLNNNKEEGTEKVALAQNIVEESQENKESKESVQEKPVRATEKLVTENMDKDDKIIRVKVQDPTIVDKLAQMEEKVEQKMEETVNNTGKEGSKSFQKLTETVKKLEGEDEEKNNPKIKRSSTAKPDDEITTVKMTNNGKFTQDKISVVSNTKSKRSVTINGKTFGDYKSKTVNLRKWKPEDMLTLPRVHMMSRSSFNPEENNNIYRSYDNYNRNNNNLKSKRSIDLDADSKENEIGNTINEITKYSEDSDTLLKTKDGKTNTIQKITESPTYVDDHDYKLKSFNDVKEKRKPYSKQASRDNIQRILPKEEQKGITQFFDNLKGLLQSIGKKLETSFKSLIN